MSWDSLTRHDDQKAETEARSVAQSGKSGRIGDIAALRGQTVGPQGHNHEVWSGVRGGKGSGFAGVEAEPPVIGGIAKNEDAFPSLLPSARQTFLDHAGSDAAALMPRQYRDWRKPKRAKRRIHPRKHDVADKLIASDGDKRICRVAVSAQPFDQVRLSGRREGDRFDRFDYSDIRRHFGANDHLPPPPNDRLRPNRLLDNAPDII